MTKHPAKFEATHTITPGKYGSAVITVMLVEGAAYTREEWAACASADFEVNERGEWARCGEFFVGSVRKL